MSDLKLTIEDQQLMESLDKIEKRLGQVGVTADATGKKLSESLTGPDADAKRVAASLAEYNAAQEKLKAGTQDRINANAKMREGLEKFRKEQAAMNAATEEGAKKNVEIAGALKGTAAGLADTAQTAQTAEVAVKGSSRAMEIFNTVLKLSPIGILLALVAKLIQQFTKYQDVIDAGARVTAVFSATINVVIDRLSTFVSGLYKFFTLDFEGAAKDGIAAFSGIGDAIYNAAVAADDNEVAIQKLRDAQLAASVSTAKLAAESEKAQAIAADGTKTYNERIAALRRSIALESEVSKLRVGFANQDLAIARQTFELSKKNVNDKETLIAKELETAGVRNNADKTRIDLLRQLNALEKERLEFISKAIEDAQKLNDKLNIDLAGDATDREILTIQKNVEDKVAAIKAGIERINEVEKLRPLDDSEIALRQKLQDNIVRVIKDGDKRITDALLKGLFDNLDAEDKIAKAKKEAADKKGDDARKALKDILDLENAKIDITQAEFANFIATLKAQGADEETVKKAQLEFDKRLNAERLQVKLDYQKALLALADTDVEKKIIEANIQELQTLLEGIDIPAPKKKPGDTNLFDLLGINLPPGQEDAIRKSIGSIIDSLGELAQARIDEAKAATDAAQEKLDTAEEALKKEEELAKQGFANNVDLKKKEVAEAKKIRDDAAKEETKAKRAAIALDSVVQLSGLITSSVNIFKSLSPLGPIGVGLAIATIGLMFGAFAASKASALKATAAPKLRSGRKFDGPTHEQGNEDLVFDGKQAYAVEKDEWLIGTAHSREHDAFLGNLNKGKYRGVNLLKAAEGKGDYQSPLNEAAPRIERLGKRREAAQEAQHFNVLAKTYERVGDRIVGAVQGQPVVLPWQDGYKIITKEGNVTTKKTVLPKG